MDTLLSLRWEGTGLGLSGGDGFPQERGPGNLLLSPGLRGRDSQRARGSGADREDLHPHSDQTGPSHKQKVGGCML